MCDVQAKLVAWLDRELPAEEASEVEHHIERCEECRHWAAKYRHLSETFDAYCDALMAPKAPGRVPRWVPVLASSVVAASLMLLVLLWTRVEPPPVLEPTVATATGPITGPSPAVELAPAAARAPHKAAVRRRHTSQAQRVQERATQGQPMDTAIQIAIPAEAMFPPGAMPAGINFVADLRIAPDGSVQQVRLRQ